MKHKQVDIYLIMAKGISRKGVEVDIESISKKTFFISLYKY